MPEGSCTKITFEFEMYLDDDEMAVLNAMRDRHGWPEEQCLQVVLGLALGERAYRLRQAREVERELAIRTGG